MKCKLSISLKTNLPKKITLQTQIGINDTFKVMIEYALHNNTFRQVTLDIGRY